MLSLVFRLDKEGCSDKIGTCWVYDCNKQALSSQQRRLCAYCWFSAETYFSSKERLEVLVINSQLKILFKNCLSQKIRLLSTSEVYIAKEKLCNKIHSDCDKVGCTNPPCFRNVCGSCKYESW